MRVLACGTRVMSRQHNHNVAALFENLWIWNANEWECCVWISVSVDEFLISILAEIGGKSTGNVFDCDTKRFASYGWGSSSRSNEIINSAVKYSRIQLIFHEMRKNLGKNICDLHSFDGTKYSDKRCHLVAVLFRIALFNAFVYEEW